MAVFPWDSLVLDEPPLEQSEEQLVDIVDGPLLAQGEPDEPQQGKLQEGPAGGQLPPPLVVVHGGDGYDHGDVTGGEQHRLCDQHVLLGGELKLP